MSSGFFTIAGKDQDQEHNDHHNNSLYLFKNEGIYNKGFELWQQYYQLHHQQKLHLQDVDLSLLASSSNSRRIISTNHVDDQPLIYNFTNISTSSSSSSDFSIMRQSGLGGGTGGSSSTNIGTMNCQDCGNQAKKDCIHMRCRTCCKSRGFQCQTHVKSTWVPAAKRRERQQQLQLATSSLQQQQHQHHHQQQLSLMRGGENPKRPRENPLACTRFPTHTSGFEVGNFPAEVSSPAVFRCVKVSAMDEADEQFAYQTAVNIGGHVFKGLLYDQGPESRYAGESSSGGGGGGGGVQQPLNLITSGTTAGVATANTSNSPPGVTWLDPSIYPTPLNAFMAGTQFFPPPRP